MTNEEKERLKDFVSDGASFIEGWRSNHSTKTKEKIEEEIDRDKKTILALIDRVPSEEEANDTWDRLKNITLKNGCDYPEYCDADNCSDFVECSVILEKIRKALNIEGKE